MVCLIPHTHPIPKNGAISPLPCPLPHTNSSLPLSFSLSLSLFTCSSSFSSSRVGGDDDAGAGTVGDGRGRVSLQKVLLRSRSPSPPPNHTFLPFPCKNQIPIPPFSDQSKFFARLRSLLLIQYAPRRFRLFFDLPPPIPRKCRVVPHGIRQQLSGPRFSGTADSFRTISILAFLEYLSLWLNLTLN